MNRWTHEDNLLLETELLKHLKRIDQPMKYRQWLMKFTEAHYPPKSFREQTLVYHFRKIIKRLVDHAKVFQEKIRILFLTDSTLELRQILGWKHEGEIKLCQNYNKIYSFRLHTCDQYMFRRYTGEPRQGLGRRLIALERQIQEAERQRIEPVRQRIEPVKQRIEPVRQRIEPERQRIEPQKVDYYAAYMNSNPQASSFPQFYKPFYLQNHQYIGQYGNQLAASSSLRVGITPSRSSEEHSAPRHLELKPSESERIAEDEDPSLTEEEKRENGIARRKRRIAEEKAKEDAKRPTIPRSSKSVYSLLEKLWTVVAGMDCSHPQLQSFLKRVADYLNMKKDELEAKKLPDETISFVINSILNSACRDTEVIVDDIWSTNDYISLQNLCKQLRRLAIRMDLDGLNEIEDKVEGVLRRIGESHVIMATKFIEVVRFGFSGYLPPGL